MNAEQSPTPEGSERARDDLLVLQVALDEQRLALPVEEVRAVLPAVASSSLPGAPAIVQGVIDLRGKPVPLLDLRERLGRRGRHPDPDDHIVVCRVRRRDVGLLVDRALDVTGIDRTAVVPVDSVAEASYVEGVALCEDGMVLVCDLASFLDADEALRLDDAVQALDGAR